MEKSHLLFMNELYESILEKIDAGIHAIDAEGKTVVYNKKMREIEAMDTHDVLHKNVLDVFMFHENENSTLVRALHHGEKTLNVKQRYFNNRGTEITTVNHTYPFVSTGRKQGAIEIAKDVTKIERLMRSSARRADTRFTFESITGKSEPIQEVIDLARRATRTSSYVLIVGESGTGKELFAQSIHNGSARSSAPFISQNCAAFPDNLIEGLLFGTAKGAFTGAVDSAGLFEQAEGGTLLLDEINSMDLHLQAKLLRALQEKKVKRVGGAREIPVDVRIIATLNEDPVEAIAGNRLRKDLYYRLGVVTVFIPPLRERTEDIPLLIEQFTAKYNALFQMNVKGVEPEVLEAFTAYQWPGNVRELEHIIEASMNLLLDEDWIEYTHLPYHFRHKSGPKEQTAFPPIAAFLGAGEEAAPLKEQLEKFEKHYIAHYMHKNNFSVSRTAKQLGLSRQSLQYRLKKVGLSSKNE